MSKMASELLRVSAPGKVILHGEHSVVYGKTALAVSVDLRTTVKLFKITGKNNIDSSSDKNLEIHMTDLKAIYTFPLKLLRKVKNPVSHESHDTNGSCLNEHSVDKGILKDEILQRISRLILERYSDISEGTMAGVIALLYLYLHMVVDSRVTEDDLEPLLIEISSEIPIGAGLGSSAAFAVTVAGAFYYYHLKIQRIKHHDPNDSLKIQDREILSKHLLGNESLGNSHPPTNSVEKPMNPLINHIGNATNNGDSPSSKSSSGCISTCSSSPSLSPPTTPSAIKRFNHSSEDNEFNNETDDEEFISMIESSNKYVTSKMDSDYICKWAFLAEKVIHGNPSGIDNSICTYGGLLTYRNRQIISIQTPPSRDDAPDVIPMIPLRILLINTNVPKNTKTQVAKLKNVVLLLPTITDHIMEALDGVAIKCLDTLALLSDANSKSISNVEYRGNNSDTDTSTELYHKLEQLIDTNQGLLKALGASHPSLDLVQAITAKQMLHSKLTGAGGGGFAFALVTPNHNSKQIQSAKEELVNNGFDCWEAQIGCHGLILEECYYPTPLSNNRTNDNF